MKRKNVEDGKYKDLKFTSNEYKSSTDTEMKDVSSASTDLHRHANTRPLPSEHGQGLNMEK